MKKCLSTRFDFFMRFSINRFRFDFRLIRLSQNRFQSLLQRNILSITVLELDSFQLTQLDDLDNWTIGYRPIASNCPISPIHVYWILNYYNAITLTSSDPILINFFLIYRSYLVLQ